MIFAFFILASWLFIILFALIKKSLTKEENFIVFFFITIVVMNIFTIITLNMKLIQNSSILEYYFCILLQRNIIIPIGLLTYINLSLFQTGFKKIVFSLLTFIILFSFELLSKWLGLKIYTGWRISFTAILLLILILLTKTVAVILKKIP
ncbi:hypothetical protein JK636_12675 [Clostridium sp. YIM B02515]|uniref:Histidine kinase N-terminal 7TM region domain-containing protein n=1 Tax=Clostridium rhizosphaerae TaxID=2803861 RepID=A0ABS1TB77_9CLOT|nr:hypothetical protein [Clostridium rhizosphaerae]MBL4936613.1 hypothetical protein [Clostridium rhizosphaerae]